MDNESKMALVQCMNDVTEHIDELNSYYFIVADNKDILVSASATTSEAVALFKCLIDNVTSKMDVETYSRVAMELTFYMRRLMEKRYGSDSELEVK